MKLLDRPIKPIFYVQNLNQNEIFLPLSNIAAPDVYPIYCISNMGRVINTVTGVQEKIYQRNNGYWYVSIGAFNPPSFRKKYNIHRLVLITFNYIPGCENLQVNHNDGNKFNNKLDNLEWVTPRENIRHAVNNKLVLLGENKPSAKLTNQDVHEICKLIESKVSDASIARDYFPQISEANVNAIHRRYTWKHISKDYNF